MAHNKIGLHVKGFEDYMARLDEVGGTDAMKRGVESALKASKSHVNSKISACMAKSNLPAGGKYSVGEGTRKSIDSEMVVFWNGMTAHINVGFDFYESGLKSIFLMHGTPKMSPVSGLKEAIYGNKTKREIAKLQGEALDKVIKRIMEG